MTIDFSRSLANAAHYPPPRILAMPKVTARHLTLRRQPCVDTRGLLVTSSGRNAIAAAAGLMRKSEGPNRILVPAYHCPALIEPFVWQGYEIVFYPIRHDLSTDIAQLRRIAADSGATHGVAIRFFGFAQNAPEVLAEMQQLGLRVLEDCAHALFDFLDIAGPGPSPAHYRICSLNKFLPTIEGGALRPGEEPHMPLTRRSPIATLKSFARMRTLNRPRRARSSAPALPLARAELAQASGDGGASASRRYRYFDPEQAYVGAFPQSRWLFMHSDYARIGEARRRAFLALGDALKNSSMGKPLYGELGDSVPYVLPFLLNDDCHFATLRNAGLQILRWEELAPTDCAVSREYRRRLIQVPCHQDLCDDDLDYIAAAFSGAVTR
jgi:hypothetical protein